MNKKIKFLIPDICIPNTYVHDLAFSLQEIGHEVVWGDNNFFYSRWQPDVIASQWPEGYFRSYDGSKKMQPYHLTALQDKLDSWRQKTLIIAFVHNIKARATGSQDLDTQLYKLFEMSYGAAHAFVHLGKNSISELHRHYSPEVYQDKPLLVISQGLHEQLSCCYPLPNDQVDSSQSFRIFVPGAIRTWAEVTFLIRAFLEARIPNKKLVIAGGGLLFDGKHPMKVLRCAAIRSIPGVLLFGHRLDDLKLSQEILSADILIAPRLWATNSAIPYLAATFGKRCIGPNIGNLPEALSDLNGILFDPGCHSSLARAMEIAYEKREVDFLPDPPCPSWREIAKEIENFVMILKG